MLALLVFCATIFILGFLAYDTRAADFWLSGLDSYLAFDRARAANFWLSGLDSYLTFDCARAAALCVSGSASYHKYEAAFSTSAFSLYVFDLPVSLLYAFHSTSCF